MNSPGRAPIQLSNTLFIAVLYKEKIEQSHVYRSVTENFEQAIHLFIYDNSPTAQAIPNSKHKLYYTHDPNNPGVGKAYNAGCRYALSKAYTWMVLLDQDTQLSYTYWRKLQKAASAHPEIGLFAPRLVSGERILSPCKFYLSGGSGLRQISSGRKRLKGLSVLNSALAVKTSQFEKAGGYHPLIPLDFSDFFFVRQYKKKVSNSFYLVNCNLKHHLSARGPISAKQALKRYRFYLQGAAHYADSPGQKLTVGLRAFYRGVKNALRFKDMRYVKYYITYYLIGKQGRRT